MKKLLLLIPILLLCSCQSEPTPTIEDAIDVAVVIKATAQYELEYFSSKTEFLKHTEYADIYHTDYIGVTSYHSYYSFEYLTAVADNEIKQIVEVHKTYR